MKNIIFLLISVIGLYQGAFAFNSVFSPTSSQRGLPNGFSYVNTSGTVYALRYTSCPSFNIMIANNTSFGGDINKWVPYIKFLAGNIILLYDETPGVNGRYAFNSSTCSFVFAPFDGGNILISNSGSFQKVNGANIDFYTISSTGLTSVIQTIPKPSAGFAVNPGTFPLYLSGTSGTNFYAYQGTDLKAYKVIDTFASGQDFPITSVGTGSVLPIGSFYTNDLILARQVIGSGSLYIEDAITATPAIELSTDYRLRSLNYFDNPKAYFSTNSTGAVVSWDMNCMTPYYSSCVLDGGISKCANSSGSLSPGGELCGGIVDVLPDASCSDGIKNQDETGIDFGGVCNCYQSSVASRSFVPFNYVNGFLQYSPFSVPLINETLNFVNTGTTWIEQYFKYSIHVNQASDSGSLLNVMSTMSGSPSGYAVHYSGTTEIDVTLYPDEGTDWTTTSNATLGSNAINHVHVFSNIPWELHYYGINDVSTSSGVVNNVEDDYESIAFPDVYGDVDLTPLNTDADRRTRRFTIVFLSPGSPTITSIQWGDINKTLSTVTKCSVKPSIEAQALANAETVKETARQNQEKLLSNNSGEGDIFACNETGLGVLICPFQIIARIWGKFTNLLQTLGNFLYGVSSIASPPGTGTILGWVIGEKVYADGMVQLPTIWHASTGSTSDLLNSTIGNAAAGVEADSGGVHSIFTFVQYFLVVILLFVVIILVVLALTS